MEHEKNDQIIFIKDLFFAALYRWRRILILALVFAILFGGVTAYSQVETANAAVSEETKQAAIAAYEAEKQLLEAKVEAAQKKVEDQERYNSESILLSLDPYSVHMATVELTVLTEDNVQYETADKTGAILHAYGVQLKSEKLIGTLAEMLDLESKYVSELIVVNNGGNSTKSLSIVVSYPTAGGAREILDYLLVFLEEAQTQISSLMGEHNSSIVVDSVTERVDLSVMDKQNEAVKRLSDLQSGVTEAENKLDSLQAPTFGAAASMKKALPFAFIGAIVGAFLAIVSACLGHIGANKVYSARVLKNVTGLQILGCFPDSGKKNGLDRLLRKLEGRNLHENSLAVTLATIVNYCDSAQKVLVTGDCDPAHFEEIAQALKERGIQAVSCGSLLRDPSAPSQLPQCDGVLLVEKCSCSQYANISLTMERISDMKKQLLGCILIDG